MTLEQIRNKVTIYMNELKIHNAAKMIQRWFRRTTNAGKMWIQMSKIVSSAKMIQRNFRATKWTRMINKLAIDRKRQAANMIQKYIRGHKDRSKIWVENIGRHLDLNFQFFDRMKEKLQSDAVIYIQYHVRRTIKKIRIEEMKAIEIKK